MLSLGGARGEIALGPFMAKRLSYVGTVLRSRPLDEPRVGGLGVFLIRALMDDVTYDMHPGQGTELVMVKRHATEPTG